MMDLIQINSTLLTPIISGLVSLLVVVLYHVFSKPLTKAQRESLVVTTALKVAEEQNKENEGLHKRITELEKEVKKVKVESEECNMLNAILTLEIQQHVSGEVVRSEVYVCDDDVEDLEEFRKVLDKSSVLDFVGFSDIEKCIKEANIHQPRCMVLDYRHPKINAEEAMKQLTFQPEIFIISGERYEKRFLGNSRVTFFKKEGRYVYDIVKEIIKYLTDKK